MTDDLISNKLTLVLKSQFYIIKSFRPHESHPLDCQYTFNVSNTMLCADSDLNCLILYGLMADANLPYENCIVPYNALTWVTRFVSHRYRET